MPLILFNVWTYVQLASHWLAEWKDGWWKRRLKDKYKRTQESLPANTGKAARWDTWRLEGGRKNGTLLCPLQMDTGREITSLGHMEMVAFILLTPAFLNLPPKNKANGTIIESRRFSPYVVIIFFFSNSNQPNVKKNRIRGRLTEENTQPSAEGCWIFNPLIFFFSFSIYCLFWKPCSKRIV